jgi:hypothetical protein
MNSHDKDIIARLEAMSLDEARIAIATKTFGDIDSPNHQLCLSWVSAKEAVSRDAREAETLAISKSSKAISEEALSIAKDANRIASEDLAAARSSAASAAEQARWARWAAILAATAAIIATKEEILSLIFHL